MGFILRQSPNAAVEDASVFRVATCPPEIQSIPSQNLEIKF